MRPAKKASLAKAQASGRRPGLTRHDLPKKQAEAVLGDLVTLTTRHLRKGDKIRLTGLRT